MVTSGTSRRSTRSLRDRLAHFGGQLGRLLERGLGEFVRHAVLAHRDFDFHAGVVDIAQHFDTRPTGCLSAKAARSARR
jgi:hypothetical protein